MNGLLQTLKDPDLVVRFQRLCGVRFKDRDIATGSDRRAGHDSPERHNTTRSRYQTPEQQNRESPTTNKTPPEPIDEKCDFVATNKFLYYIFVFGASLADELFYILFFPFLLWNVDGFVGRRVCVMWGVYMYLGQATKDVVRWPRPPSPPVVRMEARYALEYGMPSTHAMVGAGMPFSLLALTLDRYEYPAAVGWAVACTWCAVVCLSRLYLGMHTVLDVLAGLLYVTVLMAVVLPLLDLIDDFILTHPLAPYACVLVPLLLCLVYPTLDRWSTARGDTTLILGVVAGASLGHWFSYQHGLMHAAPVPPPYPLPTLTLQWGWLVVLRMVTGLVGLILVRAVLKTFTYSLLCKLFGVDQKDRDAHQRLVIELPYKFITYLVIAFGIVVVIPQVHVALGIERPSFFYEL